jgi:hypothetical protein
MKVISAETAIQAHGRLLIPNISLVEINAVPPQYFAVFLLKRSSAVVLWLRVNVLQHILELAGAHRKRTIPALPEKGAIPSIERFDPFRRCFLDLLDQVSLRKSSWQCGDNVNMISHTADAHKFDANVTADCREVSVHARPHVGIKPGLATLGAKDDVKNDLAKRLGHAANDDPTDAGSEPRFQR